MLFHIDASLMPGGFIGVDIFFVISGFLITGIIIKGSEAGSFSLKEFYRRRIKRIVPVVTFVILATLLVGHFILLPDDMSALSWSAISSQLFFANVYFTYFLDTSYFADDASLQPLLHLWSLGVEEQFYLFWPLILTMGLLKLRKSVVTLLVFVVAVASFVLGQAMLSDQPMFAYYMLPTRAGELLVGSICFFLTRTRFIAQTSSIIFELTAWVGLALIVASLALLDETSSFPGFNAIPVTVGTACLILSSTRDRTVIGSLLSLRPVVGIGLISYSMYLWHWPVLAFLKYVYVELTDLQKLVSFILIVILSYLSYVLIEQRFKNDTRGFSAVFRWQLLLPSTTIIAICLLIIGSGGYGLYYFDEGYRTNMSGLGEKDKAAPAYDYVCQSSFVSATDLKDPKCKIGSSSEPSVFLWGDSNASHYVGVIGELSEQYGFSFRNAAHQSCPPLLVDPQDFAVARVQPDCGRSNIEVLKILSKYETIILSAGWDYYIQHGEGRFVEALRNTIETLQDRGHKVIVMGRVPRISSIDRKCSQKSLKTSFLDCSESAIGSRQSLDRTNDVIKELAANTGASYYDVTEVLCDENNCNGVLDNQFIYFDKGHLSMKGSILVGKKVRELESASLVWSRLSPALNNAQIPLPWVSGSAEINPERPISSKEILISGKQFFDPLNWAGEQPLASENGATLVFNDQQTNAYAVSKFRLANVDAALPGSGSFTSLLLEITIERASSSFPMFRFGGVGTQRGLDITVDIQQSSLILKGQAKKLTTNVQERDGSLDITIEIPVYMLPEEASFYLFPAASVAGTVYSQENRGSVEISNIEAFVIKY